jgi:hypothetical protein
VVILPDGIRNYMTKFLDDNWLANRNMIQIQASTIRGMNQGLDNLTVWFLIPQVEKKGAWWEGEQVRSLNISAPHTVLPSLTVRSALGNTANNCTFILQYYYSNRYEGMDET